MNSIGSGGPTIVPCNWQQQLENVMDPHLRQEIHAVGELRVAEGAMQDEAITLHSEEHLVSSDRGVALRRRLLERQLEVVARGENPIGVRFAAASDLVELEAGTAAEK